MGMLHQPLRLEDHRKETFTAVVPSK